ncbi:MAG: FGGY family carbohydrate kinase [Micrococcales bacterium]
MTMKSRYVLALDEGSSSVRAVLFDENGEAKADYSVAINDIFPNPGWVELDPQEVWNATLEAIHQAMRKLQVTAEDIAVVGITTHRESIVVWDRRTGLPVYNAIKWSSKQTDDIVKRWSASGFDSEIRSRTGVRNDSYFSAGKIAWLLENIDGVREGAADGSYAVGTMDSWLLWKLTGGTRHATDFSAASRTALLNLEQAAWDLELAALLGIPTSLLPAILESDEQFGEVAPGILPGPMKHPVPIRSILGDQQAGLFGQACLNRGEAKNTYGTAGVLTVNVGDKPEIMDGLSSSVAWALNSKLQFEAEGVVFFSGKTIAWLRDNLGLLESSAEAEALAMSVPDNGGVYMVPAFTGLCDPHWDGNVRGAILGLQLDTTKGHLVRAGLEAMAYQTADNVDKMREGGIDIPFLRIDGGAVRNNWLCQFQADVLGVPVLRPTEPERTALGAAHIAGAAVGMWSLESISERWELDREFVPSISEDQRQSLLQGWKDAVVAAQSLPPRKY